MFVAENNARFLCAGIFTWMMSNGLSSFALLKTNDKNYDCTLCMCRNLSWGRRCIIYICICRIRSSKNNNNVLTREREKRSTTNSSIAVSTVVFTKLTYMHRNSKKFMINPKFRKLPSNKFFSSVKNFN